VSVAVVSVGGFFFGFSVDVVSVVSGAVVSVVSVVVLVSVAGSFVVRTGGLRRSTGCAGAAVPGGSAPAIVPPAMFAGGGVVDSVKLPVVSTAVVDGGVTSAGPLIVELAPLVSPS
jgi:hypothetical protein